ncbi:Aldehyde dehydrogenase [Zancudomyces culisetae]|uniref:Aldehyde dehydrogenase n=1 Tax=Zancudomyces culisetae TaxID=1213189 RepID=A0A1R1PC44_ZANCU|nr:Aldehyde dehydrogenase [Zancudomyces culisetae]|eukprot:OMH78524.1 Aldehyde dehydrogenase [Zancudomyces culisetae]
MNSALNILKSPGTLYYGGKFVPVLSGKLHKVISPADQSVLAQVGEAGKDDMTNAIAEARIAFDEGPWYNVYDGNQRRDALLKLGAVVEDRYLKDLAYLESVNTGKPYVVAEDEIKDCVNLFRHYAGYADKVHGKHVSFQTNTALDVYNIREPLGVCGMISSFNYPLNLVAWKIAPALAAGNTVIVKPAPQTPLSALFLAQIINDHQIFPSGVFNVVTGGVEAGNTLVVDDRVDKISFTGSVNGGKAVQNAAANATSSPNSSTFKHLTLELGGKSPVVVMDDSVANLDNTVYHVIQGIFANAGQNCSAGSKLYVQKGIYPEFISKLKEKTEELVNTMDAVDINKSSVMPVIDRNQYNKILDYINHSTSSGETTCLIGGRAYSGKDGNCNGNFIEPTILVNADQSAKVAKEEIFGPVLTVMKPFEHLDEVIAIESKLPFGLAAGIFSSNTKTINHFVRKMRHSGTIWVNTYNYTPANVTFGGFKNSGIGRELGSEVMDSYTAPRSVISDPSY